MSSAYFDIDRREVKTVAIIWGVVLAAAILALLVVNLNSIRLINHIEYVKANRFQRTLVLYSEAEKNLKAVMSKHEVLNRGSENVVNVPADDKNFKRAMELYSRAVALDPRDPFHEERRVEYEKMAMLYGAAGREVEQVKASMRAFLAARDYLSAENYGNALLARNPKDVEALVLLAESHMRNNKLNEAKADVARMQQAGAPADILNTVNGRLLIQQDDKPGAIAAYAEALKARPANPDLRKRLSDLYNETGKTEEAIRVLAEGLALGGNRDAEYLNRLGNAYLSVKKNAEAADVLEDAIKLERFSGDLYWQLAQAYQRLGKAAKADFALKEAFRLRPELREQMLTGETH